MVDDSDLPWGVRLHRWRADVKLWSQQEFVDQVVRLAFETKEDRGTRLDVRLVGKWETGSVRRPQSVYRRLLSGLGAPIPTGPSASAQPLSMVKDQEQADSGRVSVDEGNSTSSTAALWTSLWTPEHADTSYLATIYEHIRRVVALDDQLVQFCPLLQRGGEDGEEAMKRRAFIMQSAVLAGLGVGGSVAALEAFRRELNRSVADEPRAADVEEWRAIALDHGQTYLTTAPAALLPTLLVDLHGLRLAMRRHPGEGAQRELVGVGALLAAFTAHTVADLGDLVEARRWWRSARRAADEAADPFTMFWVRGREVVRAGYERRPVEATLQLVNEAEEAHLDLDEAPPAVLSEFLSGKAQTLALAGRHGEAERVLCQVRELPVSAAHRDSLFDYAEENLRYTESFVYSHSGNFAEAEQAQQAALALYTESNLRAPAEIELQRALCLVRSGDLAQGAGHAQAVITSLPVMHRVRPVADLGQKVFSAIPVNERRRSWALEYRECLESALPGEGVGNSVPGTPKA